MVMASQNVAANSKSRLAQMQMRFQQKRQQEREHHQQSRTELTSHGSQDMLDDEPPAITTTTSTFEATSTIGDVRNGKVRQMFDERRRGAGIDRSNPLRPIAQTRATGFQRSNTMAATITTTRQHQIANGNIKPRQIDAVTKKLSSLSLRERPNPHDLNDRNNNHNGPSGFTKTTRLNPVVTRKSPVVTQTRVGTKSLSTPPPSSQPVKNRLAGGNFSPPSPNPMKSANTRNSILSKSPQKMNSTAPKKTTMSSKPASYNTETAEAATSKCRFCGRSFNDDRLEKHEKVCQKTMATKRKIFDASKQRVKGTESEKYQKKKSSGAGPGNLSRSASRYSSAAQVYGISTGVKKSNWRKKHEDFIKTIRAAKKMQDHLNKGGKLSDLPPPPPSENPDYVQCPYCLRRFNQQAAERHIPLCANMLHNKPKPGAKAGRGSMKR